MGTSSSEYLEGTAGNDCIIGLAGDDALYGLGGDDVIIGGDGDDYINTEGGTDVLYGDGGNDTLDSGDGNDILYGGVGNDYLVGRLGVDTLNGDEGDDLLVGSGGDTLLGGAGCDVLDGSDGDNALDGGAGNDVLQGGYSPTLAKGGSGNDFIKTCLADPSGIVDGGAGTDQCDGANCESAALGPCAPWDGSSCPAGEERIVGICVPTDLCAGTCAADDTSCDGVDDDCDTAIDEDFTSSVTACGVGACASTGMSSCVNGSPGDDCVPGQAAADDATCDSIDDDCDGFVDEDGACGGPVDPLTLCPAGSNIVMGTSASEYLEGTAGNDCIIGLAGDDSLWGMGGDDVIIGGAGDDYINTEGGADVLYGDEGDDALDSGGGDDFLYGGPGADHLDGRAGSDIQDGGDGDDYLAGGGGDILLGGAGCDLLSGIEGVNSLDGGTGNDVVNGGYSPSQAHGGDGNDYISTCLVDPSGIVDGGTGADTCNGDNCETPAPTECNPYNADACPAGEERVIGICVPTDLCGALCGSDDPTCDGLDDDCDGLTDEDFAVQATSCGVGVCTASGASSCQAGAVEDSCQPAAPSGTDSVCDGLDNDCDGLIDESYAGTATSCGIGACAASGTTSCTAGVEQDTCTPGTAAASDLTCDGIDQDCDGLTDENYLPIGTTCGLGVCAASGTTSCTSGTLGDSCVPLLPSGTDNDCNGLDDDCDGLVDEDYVPTATSCGVGQCAAVGATACLAGTIVDSCTGGTPAAADATCDTLDDDCDGLIDEDYAALPTSCGVGACGAAGLTSCNAGQVLDSCVSGTPALSDSTCDGIDDDCDGLDDEDYALTSVACGIGACASAGVLSCTAGAEQDSCEPGVPALDDATCDAVDDDCDGLADEDTAEVATACGVGACESTGTLGCVGGAQFDSCRPGLAASIDKSGDGIDSDCDGEVDEDYCAALTCAAIGASCGRVETCGTLLNCGQCANYYSCGAGFTCTTDLTVRAGSDREAVWGQSLLFDRDDWEFLAGANAWLARMDCSWDFGDGSTPVVISDCHSQFLQEHPSHAYAAPGIYTVTVTAIGTSDSLAGMTATDTLTVTVQPRPSAIVITHASPTAVPGTFDVSAKLMDGWDGIPVLSSQPISMFNASQSHNLVTDLEARASGDFDLPLDEETIVAGTFGGNAYYLPSTTETTFFSGATDSADVVREPSIGSEGREFLLAFPQNSGNQDAHVATHADQQAQQGLYVHLSARTPTLASISAPGVGFFREVAVGPGAATSVQLPESLRMGSLTSRHNRSDSGLIQPLAIEIQADQPVAVHALDQIYATTDGYLALPSKELGTEYVVLAYPNEKITGYTDSQGSQIAIAADTDNTVVTVTPSVDISPGTHVPAGMQAGVPANVTLQRGETLLLANQGTDGESVWEDLSGTTIISSAPVAVFAGHACATVTVAACDHLVEQLPPVSALGRRFLTVPLATRESGDAFQLVATVDNTVVRRDGMLLAELDRGESKYFQGLSDQYSVVESTEPILLAQYARGQQYQGIKFTEPADPFMALVPPAGQYPTSHVISTPRVLQAHGKTQRHFLSLVVRADVTRGVRVDGVEIAAQWHAIGSSGWAGTNIEVPDGTFKIDHTRQTEPIGVMGYGFAGFDSYGYPAGWSFSEQACERTHARAGDGIDNDCDGRSDEEEPNGVDDDGDGLIDEDLAEGAEPRANIRPVADPAYFSIWREPSQIDPPIQPKYFVLPGYDANDDPISFELLSQPVYGTASISGRVLEYLPNRLFSNATETLQVRAYDGQDYSAPVDVTIYLHQAAQCNDHYQCANVVPYLRTDRVTIQLYEGESERELTGQLFAHDANREPIRFEDVTGDSALTLDESTGAWTYNATRASLGGLTARCFNNTVNVWDAGTIPTTGFLTVCIYTDGSDGYPVFVSSPVETVFFGTQYQYTALAVDPENQAVTYSLVNGPSWLTIDPSTGLLSGLATSPGESVVLVSATDIGGASSTQSYTLVVYGQGPTIISSPPSIGTEDTLYVYRPQATHDNPAEILNWQLALSPEGMTIDAAAGEVRWIPGASQLGPHTVRVEVSDSELATDGQTFTIVVNDSSVAPEITSTAPLHVHVDDYYLYELEASDPDPGDELTYVLTTAPDGMSIGQGDGLIQWVPDTAGLFGVEVTVYDLAMNSDVQQFVVEVEPDYIAPRISLSASPATLNVGSSTTISVALEGDFDPATVALTVDGAPLALDGNMQASYTATAPGGHVASATASDDSGNQGTDSFAIAVLDPADTTAPVADLSGVSDDDVFTYLHDLVGTATDDNLLHYTLALRPTAGAEFSTFFTGYQNVNAGVLTTFDTTLLDNGYYELRLTATDVNGLTASDSRRVRIHGNAKVGVVQLAFVDMAIEMAGIPLTVIRSYNSRSKHKGDFGYGWNLDIRGGSVSHSRPIGEGFAIYTGTDDFEFPCQRTFEQDTHFTEVRLSDDEWYLFKPVAVNIEAISGSCHADIIFEQVDGSRDGAELFVLGDTAVRALPQPPTNNLSELFYGQLTDGETATRNFDPRDMRIELDDGRIIDLNTVRGITRLEDANGNVVQYEDDYILHSDGRGIEIYRDQLGRVTTIVDPMGNMVQYQYNDAGDLVGVVDLLGAMTQFVYEAPIAHHLTDIIDPLGNRIAAMDYDQDGRLVSSCDAEEQCTRVDYDLVGRSQTMEDPTRRQTSFTYDNQGNVLTSTDGLGNTTTMTYVAFSDLVETQTDPLGNVTRWTYNGHGDVLSRIDPHAPGEDPADHTVRFEYGAGPRYRLLKETNKAGASIHRDYNAGGHLTQISDDNGNVIYSAIYHETLTPGDEGSWHLLGKMLSNTDRYGTNTFEYTEGLSGPTRVVNSSGVETLYSYDDNNRPIAMTRGGRATTITYDAVGRQTSRDYGAGVTVDFGYTVGEKEWTSLSGPTIGSVSRSYSKTGRLSGVTMANGDTFAQEFDGAGRIATETDALGNRTLYTYDGAGRLESVTREADGATTSYVLDAAGKVLSATDAENNTYSQTWENNDQVTYTDARGFTSSFDEEPTKFVWTDALGRTTTRNLTNYGLVASTEYSDATQSSTAYDGTGWVDESDNYPLSHTDEAGRQRAFGYEDGEMTSASRFGDSASWNYTYTDAKLSDLSYDLRTGEVSIGASRNASPIGGGPDSLSAWPRSISSMVAPSGEETSWGYDARGHLSSIVFPDGGTEQITNGSNGMPATRERPDGTQLSYSYDDDHRETGRTSNTAETRTFDYGPGDRMETASNADGTVTYGYDAIGQLSTASGAQGGEVDYQYDKLGRPTHVAVVVGTTRLETTYTYDEVGNIASVTDPAGGVTTFDYDAVGRLTSCSLPNGVTSTWSYDLRGRSLGVEHRVASGDLIASRGYIRAPAGEPSRVTSHDGDYVELGYDDAGRVTAERHYDAADVLRDEIEYSYDIDGNRSSRVVGGVTEDYVYSAGASLGRIEVAGSPRDIFGQDVSGRTVAIDRAGRNLTLDYSVDDDVTNIDNAGVPVASYGFDAMGGRDSVTHQGASRSYLVAPGVHTGMLTNFAVLDDAGQVVMTYVYAGEHPLLRIDAAGNRTYYLQDPQGTTIGFANEAGAGSANFEYDGFGNVREASGVDAGLSGESLGDYRFQGMWLDPTGLYYVRARSYDSETGRFLSRDPAVGYVALPESTAPYVFVGSNPWTRRDPTGRFSLIGMMTSVIARGKLAVQAITVRGAITSLFKFAVEAVVFEVALITARNVAVVFGADPQIVDTLVTVAEFAFYARALLKGGQYLASAAKAGSFCFAAETLIESMDGLVPIEDIQVGDVVWSRDDETGEEAWRPVVRLFTTPNKPLLELDLLEVDGDEEELFVTAEHPLWTRDGWTTVGELALGDLVWGLDGWAEVTGLEASGRTETVYNFEVEDFHTYFVGQAGVWAHNSCRARRLTSSIKSDKRLVKEASKMEGEMQRSIDALQRRLAEGDLDPGIGTKKIFGEIFEARARNGARLYFRVLEDGGVDLVGVSGKANQNKVIKILSEIFDEY